MEADAIGPFISCVKAFGLYPVDIRDRFNAEMKERSIFSALSFCLS